MPNDYLGPRISWSEGEWKVQARLLEQFIVPHTTKFPVACVTNEERKKRAQAGFEPLTSWSRGVCSFAALQQHFYKSTLVVIGSSTGGLGPYFPNSNQASLLWGSRGGTVHVKPLVVLLYLTESNNSLETTRPKKLSRTELFGTIGASAKSKTEFFRRFLHLLTN